MSPLLALSGGLMSCSNWVAIGAKRTSAAAAPRLARRFLERCSIEYGKLKRNYALFVNMRRYKMALTQGARQCTPPPQLIELITGYVGISFPVPLQATRTPLPSDTLD